LIEKSRNTVLSRLSRARQKLQAYAAEDETQGQDQEDRQNG